MAAELRWILGAVGVLLVAGLWWWERRRPLPPIEESSLRVPDRFEPRLDADSLVPPTPSTVTTGDAPTPGPTPDLAESPIRATDERRVHRLDPRVVLVEDLPENAEDVVLAARTEEDLRGPRQPMSQVPVLEEAVRVSPSPPKALEPPAVAPDAASGGEPEPSLPPQTERLRAWSAPPVAPDPLADSAIERARSPAAEPPPRQQRIVGIRLVALPDRRIEGEELKQALAAEGLQFGRYSIFHRMLEGDRPIYSLASLVEPGSFEPDAMASMRFPGVSMFAVFPGPLPAPKAFDDLLATARRLADRLGGLLQDDTGSSLTGQRVLSIREDLVQFEHLLALSRTPASS